MKVKRESSRLVKPCYDGIPAPTSTLVVPLSVFDTVNFDIHIAGIYAYRPPVPPNSKVAKGLAVALSEYRELAGRMGSDANGRPAILLNDGGVRFLEASVDCALEKLVTLWPSPSMLSLYPSLTAGPEELAQVQLTRFACGSLVVGFTAHHMVADGHATSNFLVAWGKATRGLPMDPLPLHGRSAFFVPRNPPKIEFEHGAVEFKKQEPLPPIGTKVEEGAGEIAPEDVVVDVLVHKAHFAVDFLTELKAKTAAAGSNVVASAGSTGRPYSTFQCLLAHLWRVMTRARELGPHETTQLRIAVNGRSRLRPPVPEQFFGNMVLWAFPRAKAGDLLAQPLAYAATLIRDAVARVDDAYFRSFVDYASSGSVEAEGLMSTAETTDLVLCPNLDVDSWLGFPFYDLDFGGGGPFLFMPGYLPVEGAVVLVRSFIGDGSIDAYLPLFRRNLATFDSLCYAHDA